MTRARNVADIIKQPFTTTLGTSNYRAGVNAGNSIASGGNFNVAVGDEAGTALTTGDANVAIGFKALHTEDAHGFNVAIGSGALQRQDAGADAHNVAIGSTAGTQLTTSIKNTLIGSKAGEGITSGDGLNVAVGYGALGVASNTTQENVAIGNDALSTEDGHGRNVAVGFEALKTLNAGALGLNTAVGQQAGKAMTTGIRNTLVGALSGDSITDSDFNVALGYASLSTNVLGSRNTAIGFGTLETLNPVDGNGANVAADTYNVAVGHAAGTAITTGIVNTYLGGEAGAANTVGNNNVALGFKALFTDSHGSQSVAVGVGALQVQDNGTTATSFNNTAVGYNAGLIVTTGVGNVLLGANAGSNVTTGGGNIIIGDSDGEAAGANHQIIMGNSVSGVGQDDFTFGRGGLDCNIAFGSEEITAPSDQRYKEDIADATAGLAFIKDLRPVTFKWRKEKDVPSDHPCYVQGSDTRVMNDYTNHGFIAQEVKTAIDAHSEIKDGFRLWSEQGLDEDGNSTGGRQRLGSVALIPILVKAIQELEARIATLEG